ncbi:alpha/beta hydrolase family protein [Streptomyces sp. YKOK-I1]
MFEYFPGNYVWSMPVVGALTHGATIAEVDEACAPIRGAATLGSDVGTGDFLKSWTKVADRLHGLALEDIEKGRLLSASAKLGRASNYLLLAERMQSGHGEERLAVYRRALELQHQAIEMGDDPIEIVEVPYGDSTLPAYFHRAKSVDGRPAPCIVQLNGFDSFKESMIASGFPAQLARRGVSTLMVDQPGTGGALRLNGLTAIVDSERYGAACLDYLAGRDDVDQDRIGVLGWSLGGYFAPRAAAFEQRFALCVAWGANHDWGAVQRRRLASQGENPVPHYWNHAFWVWGQPNLEEFSKLFDQINLDGVVEKITVPFLITHGVNDRQIPVEYAHQSYDQAVNSPKRELRIFTEREGGVEHAHIEDTSAAISFIADWISETFDELHDKAAARGGSGSERVG